MTAIENRQNLYKVDTARLKRRLSRLLKALNRPEAEVSVLLLDDAQIREFNRSYLERDRPTNVISFAMGEGEFGSLHPNLLGDILISLETAARDAEKGGLAFLEEVDFLLIHGLLHLLGYDHEGADKARGLAMKEKERELFSLLGGRELDPEDAARG